MKEFDLTPEMDRIPQVNQPEVDEVVDVAKDLLLLKALRRATVCGCPQCKAGAEKDRETLRGPKVTSEPKPLAPAPAYRFRGTK